MAAPSQVREDQMDEHAVFVVRYSLQLNSESFEALQQNGAAEDGVTRVCRRIDTLWNDWSRSTKQ